MRDLDRILSEAADAGRQAAAPLPPAQIRRVAGRVRRVRAVTASTLAVAVAAGVVIVVTSAGAPNAGPDYIVSPAPSQTSPDATAPPSTPPTSSATALLPVLDQLLTVDDVAQTASPTFRRTWAADDRATEATCVPAVAEGTVETGHVRYAVVETPLYAVDQSVEAFATPTEAASRLDALKSFFLAYADDGEITLEQAYTMRGVGDAGFAVVMQEPSSDTSMYVQVRAATTGRIVTWTTTTADRIDGYGVPVPRELVPAVNRLCGASGGTCVAVPVLDQTYPLDLPALTAGLVDATDVAQVAGGAWAIHVTWASAPGYSDVDCPAVTDGVLASVRATFETTDSDRPVPVEHLHLYADAGVAQAAAQQLTACRSDDTVWMSVGQFRTWSRDEDREVVAVRVAGRRMVTISMHRLAGPIGPVGFDALEQFVTLVEGRLSDAASF